MRSADTRAYERLVAGHYGAGQRTSRPARIGALSLSLSRDDGEVLGQPAAVSGGDEQEYVVTLWPGQQPVGAVPLQPDQLRAPAEPVTPAPAAPVPPVPESTSAPYVLPAPAPA
ncbi:hypothetical protein G6048_45250, partial [Streptomyces sp. YC419]|nr:hypothetical protein [Streptomyces ureilyticus]